MSDTKWEPLVFFSSLCMTVSLMWRFVVSLCLDVLDGIINLFFPQRKYRVNSIHIMTTYEIHVLLVYLSL